MDKIISQIKTQEAKAQQIISDAEAEAKKIAEKTKLEIAQNKEKTTEENKQYIDKIQKLAGAEAQKEADNILAQKNQETAKLDKIDIDPYVDLAAAEVLANCK